MSSICVSVTSICLHVFSSRLSWSYAMNGLIASHIHHRRCRRRLYRDCSDNPVNASLFASRSLPNDFTLKIILAENLVEHDLDVVAGVPVAVVIKAAGLFEDAGELHAARAHVVNVGPGGFVAVFKGALLLGLAPEDFVVAVGVERRVNVNQIHAGVGQFGELFQIVAAINDAGVEEGR